MPVPRDVDVNRRQFLRVGALFVPVVAAPRVAYSFIWAPPAPRIARVPGLRGFPILMHVGFPAALYAAYLRAAPGAAAELEHP